MKMVNLQPELADASPIPLTEVDGKTIRRPSFLQKAKAICSTKELAAEQMVPYAAFVWSTLQKTACAAHLFSYTTNKGLLALLEQRFPFVRQAISATELTGMVMHRVLPPPHLLVALATSLQRGGPEWLDSFLKAAMALRKEHDEASAEVLREQALAMVRPVIVEPTQAEKLAHHRRVRNKVRHRQFLAQKFGLGRFDHEQAAALQAPVATTTAPAPTVKVRQKKKSAAKAKPVYATWADRVWAGHVAKLKVYVKTHGTAYVTFENDPLLYAWCIKQRHYARNGKLSKKRTAELDKLGFIWEYAMTALKQRQKAACDAGWMTNYNALKLVFETTGVARVSVKDNPALYRWGKYQRDLRRQGALSDERIALLDEIQFEWGQDHPACKGKLNLPPGLLEKLAAAAAADGRDLHAFAAEALAALVTPQKA